MTEVHPEHRLVTIMVDAVKRAQLYRSCLTCIKFAEDTEQCEQFKQRPPARIIAAGCDQWDETPPF